jgi:hypothetical protein
MTTHDYHSISTRTGLIFLLLSVAALGGCIVLYEQTASTAYKTFAAVALLLIGISLDILKNNFRNYRRRKQLRPMQIEPELPQQQDFSIKPIRSPRFKWFKSSKRRGAINSQIELSNGHRINLRTNSGK